MNEQFGMKELHRLLLARSRVYLLHNLCPTEMFWATLLAKELLSHEMLDDIKECRTSNRKISKLLDVLPARGPNAFDNFCEALLECDHAHVAEYLKTLEVTDMYRHDIQPHCIDVPDALQDRLVNIFKRTTPTVQRFAERKFEIILEEQERDLQQRDDEIKELQAQKMQLELQLTQLSSFFNSCGQTVENVANEMQRDFMSRYFIREEKKHLEDMQNQTKDVHDLEKVCKFYANMLLVLGYLESRAGPNQTSGQPLTTLKTSLNGKSGSLQEKLQMIQKALAQVTENVSGIGVNVSGHGVRIELENVLRKFQEITDDVFHIKDVFKSTLKQKNKLEAEILTLVHNQREIRRLEREEKEKQSHIVELDKQGQIVKKKSKHKKLLDEIHVNIEQKKMQMREIHEALERRINSADQRFHSLLNLLPDLDEDDIAGIDTDSSFEMSSNRQRGPAKDQLTPRTPKAKEILSADSSSLLNASKAEKQTPNSKFGSNNTAAGKDIAQSKMSDSPRKDKICPKPTATGDRKQIKNNNNISPVTKRKSYAPKQQKDEKGKVGDVDKVEVSSPNYITKWLEQQQEKQEMMQKQFKARMTQIQTLKPGEVLTRERNNILKDKVLNLQPVGGKLLEATPAGGSMNPLYKYDTSSPLTSSSGSNTTSSSNSSTESPGSADSSWSENRRVSPEENPQRDKVENEATPAIAQSSRSRLSRVTPADETITSSRINFESESLGQFRQSPWRQRDTSPNKDGQDGMPNARKQAQRETLKANRVQLTLNNKT